MECSEYFFNSAWSGYLGLAVFVVILGHLKSSCVFSVMENLALIIGVALSLCCMMGVFIRQPRYGQKGYCGWCL